MEVTERSRIGFWSVTDTNGLADGFTDNERVSQCNHINGHDANTDTIHGRKGVSLS